MALLPGAAALTAFIKEDCLVRLASWATLSQCRHIVDM